MEKIKLLTIWALLLTSSVFSQEKLYEQAKLNSARVYFRGAELSHEFNVKVPSGSSTIVVSNLADFINESTLSVGSNKSISIINTSFTDDFNLHDQKNSPVSAVADSIKRVQDQLKLLSNQISSGQKSLELLDSNRQIPGSSNLDFTTQLSKLLEYYNTKRTALSQELDLMNSKRTDLVKHLELLQARLQTGVVGLHKYGKGKVIIQVESPQEQNVSFSVKYFTPRAGWNPFYELNIPQINKEIQVVYKANVTQNTGLDWDKVNLSLSSGYANENNLIPQWDTWFLDYHKPMADRVMFQKSANASMEVSTNYDSGYILNEMQLVRSQENQLNVSFDINRPYSINSDHASSMIILNEFTMPAIYTYFSAVKLDPSAYLVASVQQQDYSQYNLLAGQANIMFEGAFVGKTDLDLSSTKDELKINLGRDPKVAISRRLISDKGGSKLLSGRKTDNFVYEIVVKNNKSQKIDIVIEDQYPVSSNTDIEVLVTQQDGAVLDPERGLFIWNLKLPSQQSKELRFGYSIKYNKDQRLNL